MNRFPRIATLGTAALAAALVVVGCGGQPAAATSGPAPAALVSVVSVAPTNVGQTDTYTGTVAPVSSIDVVPKQSGTLLRLPVVVGQSVQPGQVLAQLDATQLRLTLEQQQAALEQAQAKLQSEQAGPRPEDVATAQLAVQTAQSKLQTLFAGPRPENVAQAQAAVQSAQAAVDAAQQKVTSLVQPRPQTVTQAQAAVVTAQQDLVALEQPRPQTVAQAQLALDTAQQKLATVQQGPRAQTVAQAQAGLVTAQQQVAALQAGPTVADLAPVQIAVSQAKDQLNVAQISRDAACNLNQFGNSQAGCNAANAQVNAAQSGVDAAVAALAKAQQPPTPQALAQAQAAVQQAQAQLGLAQQPYTAQDLASAQDAVKTAQAQLALAEQPGSAQDLAKAQAAVQSAQAGLALAEQPGSAQDIASAKDAATQAQAAVAQAQAALGLAAAPYTAEDIQQAKLAVQSAQAQLALAKAPYTKQDLAQAQAAVDQAQAAVDQAQENVRETTVVAPVGGVITAKPEDVGAQVGPQTALVTLASPQTDVEVDVPQSQLAGIAVGKPAQITASGVNNGQPLAGKVTNVAPSANTTSRTFTVKVTPEQAASGLLAGTFATVGITTVEHAHVLAVPSGAVVQRNGQNVVFVVTQGIAKAVPVTLGVSNGTLTEVAQGVSAGAQVVAQGQDSLVDGDHVTITANAG